MKNYEIAKPKSANSLEELFSADPNLAAHAQKLAVLAESDFIYYSKKYLLTVQEDIQEQLEILFDENPDFTTLEVMDKIWTDRPKNMAPRLVRELMIFICDEWEKLQASRAEQVEELELAAA